MDNSYLGDSVKRRYMEYTSDGILDLFIGFVVLLSGFMLFTELVWMVAVYVAIFVPVIWSSKEKVTVPRLRREELKPDGAGQSNKLIAGLVLGLTLTMVLGLAVFLLFRGKGLLPEMREVVLLIAVIVVGLVALSGFLAVGSLFKAQRFFAYALLAVMVAALAWWQQIGIPWVLITIGGVMVVVGFIYLTRFLSTHPVLSQEERPVW